MGVGESECNGVGDGLHADGVGASEQHQQRDDGQRRK